MSDSIITDRLELRPMSVEFIEASLRGDRVRASELLGAVVPPGWPDIPRILELRSAQLRSDPELQRWLLRAMCDKASRRFVGHIGFHSGPGQDYLEDYLPGGIELGYTVFESYRRRGYAREAVLGLMSWARRTHGLSRFVLSISPDNRASQSLAHSLGFVRVGRHIDDVDGEEDVLGLDVAVRALT